MKLVKLKLMFGSLKYILIINVNLIHMCGFQQEAAFGCQSISNLFKYLMMMQEYVGPYELLLGLVNYYANKESHTSHSCSLPNTYWNLNA